MSTLRRSCGVSLLLGSWAIAACGSVNRANDPKVDGGTEPDAATDAPADAAPPKPRCDPKKPFDAPRQLDNVSSKVRDQGAVLADELTLYLGSDRDGTSGIFVATRASATDKFGAPTPLKMLNASGSVSGPTLTADGLTLYYSKLDNSQGEIYVTARAKKTDEFPAGAPVAGINSTVDDLDPHILRDGSALYFDSVRNKTSLHLWMATRGNSGAFNAPQELTALNTDKVDGHPIVSADGLAIYWSSTRSDTGNKTDTDVWMATRPTTTASFVTPTRVAELSSTSNESPSWLSADGCEIYLQSDRAGTLGAQDIWVATRPL